MRTHLFKSCRMTPLWINSEYIKISLHTVYTVIRCIYGNIRHIYGTWKSHIRFGPTLHVYAHNYTHTNIHRHSHTDTEIHTYTHTIIHTQTYLDIHTPTQKSTHKSTHAHTHTLRWGCGSKKGPSWGHILLLAGGHKLWIPRHYPLCNAHV
jgi:hypothetical protein